MTEPLLESVVEPSPSRRDLMLGLTSLGGLMSLLSAADAQSPPTTGRTAETMLLRRISYGVTEADLAEMRTLGFDAYLDRQLNMTAVDDRVCEADVAKSYPRVLMPFKTLSRINDDWETSNQLMGATLYRAAFSKRQLYNRMCEFWYDHLNIFMWKVGAWQVTDYANTVIRKHALGKFPDMLWACAHHPAMMNYLDNASSEGNNPNQNYARELMELHTLGVTGGYTQTDVEEVAKCLTGWGVQWDSAASNYAEFEYHDWAHADGQKTVLGHVIPAGGGIRDGEQVLRLLSMHPNTAKFIAKKLVHWIMGDGTFTTLESQVASTYLQTGGDIKAMLRVILKRNNLLVAGPRFKRPFHLYASSIRSLKAKFNRIDNIRWAYLGQSGHEPYTWPPPNGYPDNTAYWASLLLPRWNFMLNAMSGGLNELQFNWRTLIGTTTTPDSVLARLNALFFANELSAADKARLLAFLKAGAMDENRIRGSIALAMCSPSFQWY